MSQNFFCKIDLRQEILKMIFLRFLTPPFYPTTTQMLLLTPDGTGGSFFSYFFFHLNLAVEIPSAPTQDSLSGH